MKWYEIVNFFPLSYFTHSIIYWIFSDLTKPDGDVYN